MKLLHVRATVLIFCCTVDEYDFLAESTQLFFSPQSSTSQCVTVEILDDTILENSEFFTYEFYTSDERVVLPPSVDVTIRDDEREWCMLHAMISLHLSACLLP